MVLKLYSHPQSTGGRRVAIILHEKQVPYELVEANWAETQDESGLTNHPFGHMPYIDDDGLILFESRAISRYLVTKYASQGTPLVPAETDPKTMALIDQAISIERSNFDSYAMGLITEKVYKPSQGLPTEPTMISKFEMFLGSRMLGFERLLSKQKYIAGGSLTFVDLFFCPSGSQLAPIGYDFLTNETKYPNVARWFKEITSRDSWKAVLPAIPKSL